MDEFWDLSKDSLISNLSSDESKGLTSEEALGRLNKYGKNTMDISKSSDALSIFISQFKNPIIIILIFATLISIYMKDYTDSIIIFIIIIVSGLLSFWQEYNANTAVEELLSVIKVKSTVLRDGRFSDIDVENIVPGDIVKLSTGDIIPGDSMILSSNSLYVDESSLTGETFPVEKKYSKLSLETPLAERTNSLWMGTHITSGSAIALIVNTGKNTEFGKIYDSLKKKDDKTEFEKGIQQFGFLLIKITSVLVTSIFIVNILLKKPILDSFMFSLALAVGLTPQLLPAIMSINLSRGAKSMAKENVIVKKLPSIENFGSMDVLCSDKTGTITEGRVLVNAVTDIYGKIDESVLFQTYLNSSLQTGFENPIDSAIKEYAVKSLKSQSESNLADNIKLLFEKPYNFEDKRLSIAIKSNNKEYTEKYLFGCESIVITKGAVSNVLDICTRIRLNDNRIENIESYNNQIMNQFAEFSKKGYRTLAVSYKEIDENIDTDNQQIDSGMIFMGFITLFDPIKEGMIDTINTLKNMGVTLKIITGDNKLVASSISEQLGISGDSVVTGEDLKKMDDDTLKEKVKNTFIFAEIEPSQKERIVSSLQTTDSVVGYMGDGINDAAALKKADVGISVNTAVDIAKDSASIVLLESDLNVLIKGIKEGRRTFANTLKYVFMATSANFGNMFSMAGASLFLSFLPLLPKQVLLTNLITDLPEMQIATDEVDEMMVSKPKRWNISFIKKFMMVFGLLSSVFDYATFGILLFLVKANPELFRTGWFVESIISATMIVLVIRTRGLFYKNKPGKMLLIATMCSIALTLIFPYLPFAKDLGFTPLPIYILGIIFVIVFIYVVSAEIAKHFFYKKYDF